MQVSRDQLTAVVVKCAEQIAREGGLDDALRFDGKTELFGGNSPFDSLMLVSLVFELETAIEAEYGVRISLASERAMSEPVSPFGTVDTLVEFAQKMLAEA